MTQPKLTPEQLKHPSVQSALRKLSIFFDGLKPPLRGRVSYPLGDSYLNYVPDRSGQLRVRLSLVEPLPGGVEIPLTEIEPNQITELMLNWENFVKAVKDQRKKEHKEKVEVIEPLVKDLESLLGVPLE